MQTLALYDIFSTWRDALAQDAAIAAWCQDKYGKGHLVLAGLDLSHPPGDAACPYIVLRAGTKIETDAEPYRYAFSVGWTVFNSSRTENGNITELDGTAEVDALGQLILSCLNEASQSHPITRVDYDIDSIERFPKHFGEMLLEVEIDPAIGGALIYP